MQEVGRITRLQVQDALKKLDDSRDQAAELVEQLRGQVAQLDPGQAVALKPIVDEIAAGLSADTLARLSDYQQFGQSDTIAVGESCRVGRRRMVARFRIRRTESEHCDIPDRSPQLGGGVPADTRCGQT